MLRDSRIGLPLLIASLLACAGVGSRGAVERPPIPVEVGPVTFDEITAERVLAGTLTSSASIEVIARVRGRVAELRVDLGDPVARGAVVAVLEDDEIEQAERAARAAHAGARAEVVRAEAMVVTRERELERTRALAPQGAASQSELDASEDAATTARAALAAARAHADRTRAELDTARARTSYTRVVATWSEGDAERRVAARHVDEGSTVQPEQPLFTVIDLDPLLAVVSVTERDYAGIEVGQRVTLHTDTHPERAFEAHIARVAPVFDPGSRQARVEIRAPNPEGLLKPGMYVRVRVEVGRSSGGAIVPRAALTRRADVDGVFVIDDDGRAQFRAVGVGLSQGERVEVHGDGVIGRVVTLGHQELTDGVRVQVIDGDAARTP